MCMQKNNEKMVYHILNLAKIACKIKNWNIQISKWGLVEGREEHSGIQRYAMLFFLRPPFSPHRKGPIKFALALL